MDEPVNKYKVKTIRMLNKIAMASGLALLSLVAAPQAFAWDKIGSKNIGHGGDRDVGHA